MITLQNIRDLIGSLPETVEAPHFEKLSFRVKKKILATYDARQHSLTVKLTEILQDMYCSIDTSIIYPVPNKWGKQGWTIIDLSNIDTELLNELLKAAYRSVAPQKLDKQIEDDPLSK